MRAPHWLLGLTLGATASAAYAQEPPPGLTEELAVRQALAAHPLLRMAEAEAAMAEARTGAARSERALQVSVNGLASLGNMGMSLAVPEAMPQALLQSRDRGSLDLNGMAMLPLSTGGRIAATVRAAELTAAGAQSRLAAMRVMVAYETRLAFQEWRAAVAMAKVAADALTAQQRQADRAQQMLDVGKVPRFDVLRTAAALAAAQQEVVKAQAEVTATAAALAELMVVPTAAFSVPADEEPGPTPEDALGAALSRRPELTAAQHDIGAAQATVRARQAAYRPQWYAVAMADALAPPEMGQRVGVTVGVVAGLPIGDGGRRRAEVDEAEQALAQAKAARENVELQVRAEVAAAEARLGAARQNIPMATAQVAAAQEAYDVAQVRYEAGKGILVELLDALSALTEAQQSVVVARADCGKALAELYRAMGVEVPAP